MTNEYKLNIGVEDIREIKMSPEEKKITLERVRSSFSFLDKPVSRLDQFYSLWKRIRKNRFIYYGLMSSLVVVICLEIIFTSNDIPLFRFLYPLKANIIEQASSVLHFSPGNKVWPERKLTAKPLMEVETQGETLKIRRDTRTKPIYGAVNKSKQRKLSKNEEDKMKFTKNTYRKLLSPEVWAKGANIFLNSGLSFNEKILRL